MTLDEQHRAEGNILASPLRVETMDANCRQLLRNYLQAFFINYHEDENGRPTYPPNAPPIRTWAAAATAEPLRRPARGLVTLRTTRDSPDTQGGVNAILEISAEGNLTILGGAGFDEVFLKAALPKLSVYFSEDPTRSSTFVISVSNNAAVAQSPAICCVVRDWSARSKWLNIFRRRGVTPQVGGATDI